jgi:hypothetical protein
MDAAVLRHADRVAALRRAVFESAGATDPAIRQAVGAGDPVPEPWGAYAEKVREQSYRVTDADIAALKAAGGTEEEVFEVTVAAMGFVVSTRICGPYGGRRDVRLDVLERGQSFPPGCSFGLSSWCPGRGWTTSR